MTPTRRDLIRGAGLMAAAASLSATTQAQSDTKRAPIETPDAAVNLFDFEALAKERIPHPAWEYINSGAADEITLRWNREAYDKIRLNPRVLRDVSKINTAVEIFGHKMDHPIMLAPSALHTLAHPEGEVATARGAGAAAATMVLSTMSSYSVEDVHRATSEPVWFQLYVQSDKGFTKHLVQRAEAAGCKALVITVDTPTTGARNRSERGKFDFPPNAKMPHLAALGSGQSISLQHEKDVFNSILPANLTWKDIEWLQSLTKVPVLLKGILHPDDAEIAAKQGIQGVLVSNHGARNLDTAPATIDALPRIADRVGGRMVVLVDGAVRRGTDVLKALAFGANAVLIGRPVFYGLSVAGAQGVTRSINILRTELEMAMSLTGAAKLADINRSLILG